MAAESDPAQLQKIQNKLKSSDPNALKEWGKRSYQIKPFSPTSPSKQLPEGGDKIGLASDYQTHIGMKLKLPKNPGSTPGRGRINDALKDYGYVPAVEHTDGDHVVEIQLGGIDDLKNLWPLESRLNQQAGSRLSKAQVPKPNGTTVSMSDLKDTAAKGNRGVWLVIVENKSIDAVVECQHQRGLRPVDHEASGALRGTGFEESGKNVATARADREDGSNRDIVFEIGGSVEWIDRNAQPRAIIEDFGSLGFLREGSRLLGAISSARRIMPSAARSMSFFGWDAQPNSRHQACR